MSMPEILHRNRNNSKTARSVLCHYYLYSSGLKKKENPMKEKDKISQEQETVI